MVGYGKKVEEVKIKGATIKDFSLEASTNTLKEVVVTGVIAAIDNQQTPYVISTVDNTEVLQTSATNAIDAISKVAGVSAMTNGQSISKPVIRGLGYNRVLTINDGVKQMGGNVKEILLTHGHLDHCAAAKDLADQLNIPIEGPQEDERFWIDQLPEQTVRFGFGHAKTFEHNR